MTWQAISRVRRSHSLSRRAAHTGISYVELLAAVLILAIVAAGAAATWSLSSRVPANLRVTEMASKIAAHEIETAKATGYDNLALGTTTIYYDKNGVSTTVVANEIYMAARLVHAAPGTPVTGTTSDLLEVQVTVTDTAGTKTYETQRTLLTLGGS